MSYHARFPPSSLGAIVQCAAYPRMVAPYANAPRTPEQLEGDAGHHVAAHLVSTGEALPVGFITPAGVAVDIDMLAGAQLMARTVGLYGIVELPILCPLIHADCWGTPDWRRYDGIEGVIRVWDYKYGHRFVEVFENWQLIAYLSGILAEIGASGIDDQYLRFEVGIVQPRAYHKEGPVRKWTGTMSQLRGLINIANRACVDASDPNAPARTGPECFDCAARHECEALRRHALDYADSRVVKGDTVTALPPEAIGAELALLDHAAELIEARRTGLSEQAESMMRGGVRVPGYALEEGRARESWTVPPDEIANVAGALGFNLRKPTEVLTPNQARQSGLDPAIVGMYATRPRGAMKLVKDSTTQARKIFGANSQ